MKFTRRFGCLVLVVITLSGCQSPARSVPEPTTQGPRLEGRLIDLTHVFDRTTTYWPTASGFELKTDFEGLSEGGYFYEANSFASAEHGGTHLDAPVHFAEGRQSTEQIPLERLMGAAVLIDVSSQAEEDPDYQISVEDITAWEQVHGQLEDGIILLFRTGYADRWPDAQRYLGTAERGPDAVAKLHFPGIHPDAAAWLVENRSIGAIGIDTASIDYGQSTGFESHRILYEQNIPGFENVGDMSELPPKGFLIIALPMKIGSGSGGPLRIVAIVR